MGLRKLAKKGDGDSPILPWKTKLLLAIASFVNDAIRRHDGTLNRRIATAIDARVPPDPTPRRGVSSRDVVVDSSRDLWIRIYLPADADDAAKLPVIVFFHGGGFAFLSAASRNYHAACRRFARSTPALVVSVNYRLSPEHRFPAQYEDGVDVLRFLDAAESVPAAGLGRCFLAGDSAGANIAHNVARRWQAGGARVRIAGVIAIQPFFGGEGRVESELRLARAPLVNVERTDWLWRAFLPAGEDRNHEAVNVFGPRAAELGEGFPREVMVVLGGFDPLRDWQARYVEGLRRRGAEVTVHDYPSAIHAFYLFPELPDAGSLHLAVRDFVRRCSPPTSDGPDDATRPS